MKILKGIFYTIVAIIILLLVIAIFLPSKYEVERSIQINKPVELVYGYVADFDNFHGWNPWTKLEPNHSYNVVGDSGQVGQKYSWKGEIIGSGNMTFLELNQNELIKSDINFLSPNQATGIVNWNFVESENSTKVSWSITGDADYPIGRYMGLMMDSFLGPSFEEGMKNLKEKVE